MGVVEVPHPYLGMWRRVSLEQAGVIDSTSTVLVIQTEHYHADIRIPADRPPFDGIQHLKDCTTAQLYWLATQQGFTGITEINGNICQWLRDYDFQPFNHQRDIGEMKFESINLMLEIGVDVAYRELWERIPGSQQNLSVTQSTGKNRHGIKTPARIFTANNTFAYVRPRSVQLPIAVSMTEAINRYQPNPETLLDWLDFEISFGEIHHQHLGVISLSTLPFKEGSAVALN